MEYMLAIPALLTASAIQAVSYTDALIDGVPHIRQKPDFCGEAAAAMYLRKLGKNVDQDDVFNASGVDPAQGRGAWTRELKVALERAGFDVGAVWFTIDAGRATTALEDLWRSLHADLKLGIPSIVCTHFDGRPDTTEHFRLVVGYDAKDDEVVYNEPAASDGAYRHMKRTEFLALWPLKYDPGSWTVVRFRLAPNHLKDLPHYPGFSPAAFAQHVMEVRERMPRGFSLVIEPPFVVVGDGGDEVVRQRAAGTVRWAVSRLKRDFFRRDPERILDIWLFQNASSYQRYTRALFGDTPDTPFGYFSEKHHALIMNIGTGGGTLVHEIVHPFMDANFPGRPAWLNEGLGSLFEQAADDGGHSRQRQLAPAWASESHPARRGTLVQGAAFDLGIGFLRKGSGDELRPGPIPPLLPAGAGATGEVLQRLRRESEGGSHGVCDFESDPGRGGHEGLPVVVGGLRAGPFVPGRVDPKLRSNLGG